MTTSQQILIGTQLRYAFRLSRTNPVEAVRQLAQLGIDHVAVDP